MAARAFDHALSLPQPRRAPRASIVRTAFPSAVATSYRPAPLAAMPRRSVRNAAAHEALLADIRLAGWVVVAAACIGLGLAFGLHFDDILHDVRLVAFNAEEPRWLWHIVDSL